MQRFAITFFGIAVIFFISAIIWRFYPNVVLGLFQDTPPQQKEVTEEAPEEEPAPEIIAQPPEELENVDALLQRGESFFTDGFISLAINDFSRATELSPQNINTWNKLITAQIELRDYSDAEESTQKAISYIPKENDLKVLLGEIQIKKSDFENAQKTFQNLPDIPAKKYYLAVLAIYKGEYQAAQILLEEIRNDPQYKKQVASLLTAFEIYSQFPDGNPLHLQLLLAKSLNDLRFYELSVQMTKYILTERDEYRDAWIILGHSYLMLDRYDLAKNVLQRAFELDSTKPETTFFLGLAESALGEYDPAIDHLEMARENGYEPVLEVTNALAEAYIGGKYYEAARKEYERILEMTGAPLEKFSKPIQLSLEFLDDQETAINLARRANELYPESPVAKNLLGWALLERNELNESKAILQEVIKLDPNYAAAYLNMAKLSEKEGNNEVALTQYKKAYDLSPHSAVGAVAAERYNAIVMQQ